MAGPISPQVALKQNQLIIPEVVYQTFNDLIAQRIKADGTAVIYLEEILPVIATKTCKAEEEVLALGWLDIEPAYREMGWKVLFDKPDRGESGRSFFRFTALKKAR